MITREFGRLGVPVTVLGLGAGPFTIGNPAVDDAEAGRVLNAALDLGYTLVDTARCYDLSEERIGRHISSRRSEYVLSSKTGHRVDGVPNWTPEAVRVGTEESLRRLRTDLIDVLHLHSCSLAKLQTPGLIDELDALVTEGKVRQIAYSGDNEALVWAVESGRFGSIETSINIAD